jgi:hypothetical protein
MANEDEEQSRMSSVTDINISSNFFFFFKDFKTPLLTPYVSEGSTIQRTQNMDDFTRNLEQSLNINYSSNNDNECMYIRSSNSLKIDYFFCR